MSVLRVPQFPPDRAERIHAASALVVAPHYDDELLGCGGLLLQLLAAGSAVRILFLTDGGGGVEQVGDRDAYRARRRQEAAGVAERLGWTGCDRLELPDGSLDRHLEPAAAGLRRALLAQRPDLLLVPGPLEASADHRAAFAAVHRLLSPVRLGGSADPALAEVVRDLRVLAYEINRPAYPDLLVDVSAEVEVLAGAMALYASQQERRDYWRASLGLRQVRTLTLPPGTLAAEGYVSLTAADFATSSLAGLIRRLGGVPDLAEVREGPRVSVVVRTRDRPVLLAEALASLAAGTYRPVEVVLVNDGGEPPVVAADYPLPVVRVDLAENQGRAGAANAGVAAASGAWVAFLDDDDLAAEEHLETLAGLAGGAGVRVVYTDAAIGVYELDATAGGWVCRERRLPYSRDFDPAVLLVDNYIPFNTLLIERELFAQVGMFDRELPFFEDWDFLIRLAAVAPFHHLPQVTCEYRHFRGAGHHVLGEMPRQRVDFLAMKARVLARHRHRLAPELLAGAVDTLRREVVDAGEATSAARRELDETRRRLYELGDLYRSLAGEADALRGDQARLTAEVRRLYDEEAALRAVVTDQTEHLDRTYGEIARLGGVVETMEATRAWRFHRWWSGVRRGRSGGV